MKVMNKDIKRYIATEEAKSFTDLLELFLFNYSLWVIISYRFGCWVRSDFKIPVLKEILKILTRLTHALICLITGIQIPFEARIGPGLYIGHVALLS